MGSYEAHQGYLQSLRESKEIPWVKRVLYTYQDESFRTSLVEYEPGVWEVLTYAGVDEDIVNNTGTIDQWEQALYDFALHLDLYYQVAIKEVIK